jgi:hypothetical protein
MKSKDKNPKSKRSSKDKDKRLKMDEKAFTFIMSA